MDATRIARAWGQPAEPSRPITFLVSTTGCAGDIRRHMGSADYSYTFVLEALKPVLERLGRWQLVPRPESSLAYAAARAAERGERPVHLALHPIHNIYLTPAVPTILFPFWEFPTLPDRNFGHDTRQNWVRMSQPAALILTASRECAEAFRNAGVDRPIVTIPVPLAPEHFEVPAWDPAYTWSLTCRHLVWGPPGCLESAPPSYPELSSRPEVRGPARLARALRGRYERHVRPWLGQRALHLLGRLGRPIVGPPAPLPVLPATPLTLGGLVFTSIFNFSDRRKNPRDLLTAFLLAFADRPDATLVLKLATSPTREYLELRELWSLYRSLGLKHACRVVVLTDFLTESQLGELYRATTFYVNTSHAEGACLPLQRALAAGRPGLAPAHTSMADYMDDRVGLVLRSYREPCYWPHDPERRYETTWHHLVWSDLRDGLLEAARLADSDRPAYDTLASAARARMAAYAGPDQVTESLRRALAHLSAPPPGVTSWAA